MSKEPTVHGSLWHALVGATGGVANKDKTVQAVIDGLAQDGYTITRTDYPVTITAKAAENLYWVSRSGGKEDWLPALAELGIAVEEEAPRIPTTPGAVIRVHPVPDDQMPYPFKDLGMTAVLTTRRQWWTGGTLFEADEVQALADEHGFTVISGTGE